jgi:hypothetical protein
MKKITELVTKTEKPEQRAKKKAITFGSFKRAEDRQVAERKQKEHEAELAGIAEDARIQRAVEDEHQRVIKEQNTEKRNKFVTESLSNAFKPKVKDMKSVREQVIDTYLPKELIPAAKDHPEPFKAEPALNAELAEFKKKINEHLHTVGFSNGGGGGIAKITDAEDVNIDGRADGFILEFDAASGQYISAEPSATNLRLLIDGTDGSSTNAGNFIELSGTDASSTDAGDEVVLEDGVNGPRDFDYSVLQELSSSIIPNRNGVLDLGSATNRFGSLFLLADTIDLDGATIKSDGSGQITISADGAIFPVGSKDTDGKELLVGVAETDSSGVLGGQATKSVSLFTQASGLTTAAATLTFAKTLTNRSVYTNSGHTFLLSNGDARLDKSVELFEF